MVVLLLIVTETNRSKHFFTFCRVLHKKKYLFENFFETSRWRHCQLVVADPRRIAIDATTDRLTTSDSLSSQLSQAESAAFDFTSSDG
jgi:hypothetical protein